ncbi:MAG: NUDIX domain-containing protein [Bacteroidota bacterium]
MEKKTIVAGGGLVQNESGKLLMMYRRGKWDLPKGKLDAGETIEACAVREVMEETGIINIELGRLIDIGRHDYYDRYLQEEVIKETHWFAMKAKGEQTPVPQTEEDITAIKWVSGAELEACLEDSYPNVVDLVRKFIAFSE